MVIHSLPPISPTTAVVPHLLHTILTMPDITATTSDIIMTVVPAMVLTYSTNKTKQ